MKVMTKRLFSILLVLCMMLSIMPVAAFAEDGAEPVTVPEGTVSEQSKADGQEEENQEENTSEERTSEEKTNENLVIDTYKGGQGGGSIGGFDTDESYYRGTDKFGYDSFTEGGSLAGVKSVTVGSTTLTKGRATTTTGAVLSAGKVRVAFEEGYYLTRWKVVCGDKYRCQTDSAGHAAHEDNVMSGASDTGYYDITISQKMMGHWSQKSPYWLLLEVAKDDTAYSVTYNWGDLAGKLKSDVPVDSSKYRVNASVTTLSPSEAAIEEAGKLGYVFDGWVKSNDSKVVSGGNKFAMPQANVTLTAKWKTATTSFTVTKVWNDNNDSAQKRPASITVQLRQNGADYTTVELNADNNWTHTWNDLPKMVDGAEAIYQATEPKTPEGYKKTVVNSASGNSCTITNTYIGDTIDIEITKIWNDNSNQDGKRPQYIKINLLADGVVDESIEISTYSVNNTNMVSFRRPVYNGDGTKIEYTVGEETVPAGYQAKVTGSAEEGFTITNTHVPEKITISGSKMWDDYDDQDGKRPDSITVNLLADGEKVDSKVVTADDGWEWRFTADKYNKGEEITYTITEEAVEGYTSNVTGDQTKGFTITNTHVPEKITISGSKTWDDHDDQDGKRPNSITVNVVAGGKVVASKNVAAADNWAWSFELPKYENGGQEITYTVTENAVEGYTSTVNGFDVTNTHTPETITISGEKHWVGDTGVASGDPRPASVTVYLNADGTQVAEATVTAGTDGKWTYSFANMPKYSAGKQIVYTVTEKAVAGYTTEYNGLDIYNTYNPGKTSVTVQKTWNDDNDRDGLRPDSVKVQLMNGLIKIGEPAVLNEANNWTYVFTDLDETFMGFKIGYTVKETDVPDGYEAKVTGDQATGFTVTNTHTPAITKVSVEKKWNDENDLAGFRPESVEVQLCKTVDGKETVVDTAKLDADGKWKHTWENLFANEGGKPIAYTVKETDVEYYTGAVSGSMKEGFVITNTHVPEKMKVTVTKTWDDGDNQDGLQPNSVKVTLYRNGTEVGKATLNEANNWSYTFEGMPVYAEGEKAIYTVTEASVEDYQADYSREEGENELILKVINSYTPEKTSIDVTKKWTDNNNKAGARPKSVTIYLLANGEKTGDELVLSSDNDWTGSFKDLPVNKDGKAIKYTISEKTVSKYKAKITGSAEKGFVVTNTHTSIPTTGDQSNTGMYVTLFTFGLAVAASALILSRKKNGGYGGKYAKRG